MLVEHHELLVLRCVAQPTSSMARLFTSGNSHPEQMSQIRTRRYHDHLHDQGEHHDQLSDLRSGDQIGGSDLQIGGSDLQIQGEVVSNRPIWDFPGVRSKEGYSERRLNGV